MERIVVSGTDLTIQLEGVGHLRFVDGQPERTIVNLTITAGETKSHDLMIGGSTEVGDYTITLKSAREYRTDGGPQGCDLVVTRR